MFRIMKSGTTEGASGDGSSWPVRHFSQANPKGQGQGDVPALLRRVADSIEELGPVQVHDLVLHEEITADGPWVSLTVYFDPPS
jgi:hypothetical protein